MSVNNDEFIIEQSDLVNAQAICNDIDEQSVRNRAVANVVSALIAKKYFSNLNVDSDTGIHNNDVILENIDISDIYVNGNYVDVRTYFNDNELLVPKSHFDLNISPSVYMFVKFSEDAATATVSGFILPEDINRDNLVDGYYVVNEELLKSFYDIESSLVYAEDEEYSDSFEKLVYDFLDGRLTGNDVAKMYDELLKSSDARQFLRYVINAEKVFSNVEADVVYADDNQGLDNDSLLNGSELSEEDIAEFDAIEQGDLEILDSDELELPESSELADDMNLGIDNEVTPEMPISEEDNAGYGDLLNNDVVAEVDELPEISDAEDDVLTPIEDDNVITDIIPDESDLVDINSANDDIINEVSDDGLILEELPEVSDITEVVESNDALVADEEDLIDSPIIEDASEVQEIDSPIEEPVDVQEEIAELPADDTEYDEKVLDDIDELSKFDYSTEIMPSMRSIENNEEEQELTVTEEMLEGSESVLDVNEQPQSSQTEEQIDNLFEKDKQNSVNTSSKKKSPFTLIGFLILLGCLGYYGYTKYFSNTIDSQPLPEANSSVKDENLPINPTKQEEAMPIETVENVDITKPQADTVSTDISSIEQNFNTSIDVSSLSVNWEVPVGYANNTTAKRYFMKLGKVLQLNIKTELLMLTSPPITNRISVELEFNKNDNKFNIVNIIDSSGVAIVDNTIKDTVNKALSMNMNMNMSVFGNLQGNPILIIKL